MNAIKRAIKLCVGGRKVSIGKRKERHVERQKRYPEDVDKITTVL